MPQIHALQGFTLGGAVSGGESQFNVGNGSGDGRSDFFQAAFYAKHAIGDGYIAGSIAGGLQSVRTDRSASIAGATDRLSSSFTAPTIAGRVEGGYRFAYGNAGITPYAAVQVQSIFTPNYTETSALGSGLGLSYASQTATSTRTEFGSWIDGRIATLAGSAVLRGRVAWVHYFDQDSAVTETFSALPGASFVVNGAARPADAALVSSVIDVPIASNLIASAKIDGEFGNHATTVAGTGTLRYLW